MCPFLPIIPAPSFLSLAHAVCLARSSWTTQFTTLFRRNFAVAIRDLSLYWMQIVLHATYGFLIGAMFWRTPAEIGSLLNQPFACIAWFLGVNAYMHVFKAHYFTSTHNLFALEQPNHAYHPLPYFLAEVASTMFWAWVYIPGFTIAYFMVDFPVAAYGFFFLTSYVVVFTAEGMASMIMQFAAPNTPLGVMCIQGALVIGFVFTSGVFLPLSSVPDYWNWLRVFSVFAHGGDALMVSIFKELDFTCPTPMIDTASQTCVAPGIGAGLYPCDSTYTSAPTCSVRGLTVLDRYKGFSSTDEWKHLLYLVILGLGFRFFVLVFYRWPVSQIMRLLTRWYKGEAANRVLTLAVDNQRLKMKVCLGV